MDNLHEAVKAAIKLEEEGRAFYLEAAGRASNSMTRRMFESLAEDEAKHKVWIERNVAGVPDSALANRELYARLGKIFATPPAEAAKAAGGEDVKAIDIGIGMEDKSIEAYADWAANGPDAEVRALGKVLVGIERFHRQLLMNVKEYLQSPGDWFMSQERWNFEAG